MENRNLIVSEDEMFHVNSTLHSVKAILDSIGDNAVSQNAVYLIYGAEQCLTAAISNTEKFLTAVEKTAKWITDNNRPDIILCSNCNYDVESIYKSSFCPKCGSRMLSD